MLGRPTVTGGATMRLRGVGRRSLVSLTHLAGRATRRFYFEDFVRVYPGRIAYNRLGIRRRATAAEARNFRNHAKVYDFAAQFACGKNVADVGCGSGYGCQILSDAGAAEVHACDVSRHSIRFARRRYAAAASFTRQTIVDLSGYADNSFDVVLSSEVLEHIKEYGLAERALEELHRIGRPGGLVIVGTPNSELLRDHGFSYDELTSLLRRQFGDRFLLFENAFVPFDDDARAAWEERVRSRRTGTVVSMRIDLGETIVPPGARPVLKRGLEPGPLRFDGYTVDTALLHNTHAWLALAVKDDAERDG